MLLADLMAMLFYLLVWMFLCFNVRPNHCYGPFNLCKLSHTGEEYVGLISESKSKMRCIHWNSEVLKSVPSNISFPDGSLVRAKNRCRNPDHSEQPWCFIHSGRRIVKDYCSVPLCRIINCRLTGPGVEYAGTITNSCSRWRLEPEFKFPDGSKSLAERKCRNPSGDISGLWCYKENKKEYCHVPFCNFPKHAFIVRSTAYHTHYSTMNITENQIQVSFRLWNPIDWKKAELRIAVTLLAIPANNKHIRDWDIGYEFVINGSGVMITPSMDEKLSFLAVPLLLTSFDWTNLTLSWKGNFLAVSFSQAEEALVLHEYKTPRASLIEISDWHLSYISIKTNASVLFYFPSNTIPKGEFDFCEEHITNRIDFIRFWKLHGIYKKILNFRLRGLFCVLKFVTSPERLIPNIRVVFNEWVSVIYEDKDRNHTLDSLSGSISLWKWSQFSIKIHSGNLTIESNLKLLEINHNLFRNLEWYSIASNETAHWTFNCLLKEEILHAYPPECLVPDTAYPYKGHQSVALDGSACLPWIGRHGDKTRDRDYPDGSKVLAMNYCRNPTRTLVGPYCYVFNSAMEVVTNFCNIRTCTFDGCKLSGTGNDYVGNLNISRSGIPCQGWLATGPHKVSLSDLKSDKFGEASALEAQNYCRNPSRDIGGPWCYTTNLQVEKELCDVPDCSEPEECVTLVTDVPKRKLFIPVNWKINGMLFYIKSWNPQNISYFQLFLFPKKGKHYLHFIIGEKNYLRLYYVDFRGIKALLKQRLHPHFLYSGKWTELLFSVRFGEFAMYYVGKDHPIFSWKLSSDVYLKNKKVYVKRFYPIFFNYGGRNQNIYTGIKLPCDLCMIEITNGNNVGIVFYPVTYRNKSQPFIRFYFRGLSQILISFLGLPSRGADIQLIINPSRSINVEAKTLKGFVRISENNTDTNFNQYSWTEMLVSVDSEKGLVKRNGTLIASWRNPKKLPVYFFTIWSASLYWSANCLPPSVENKVIDGGWSSWGPWDCPVSCGGGRGLRQRTCTNPHPNLFGKHCPGPSTHTGLCNTEPCGRITSTTYAKIRNRLKTDALTKEVEYGTRFTCDCYPDLLIIVRNESPNSELHWSHDGRVVSPKIKMAEIVDVNRASFNIDKAIFNNSGVYACVLTTYRNTTFVVQVTAITVISKTFSVGRHWGTRLLIPSHALYLSTIYGRVSLTWTKNKQIYKEYDGTIMAVNYEFFDKLTYEDTGVYECYVMSSDLNLVWKTSFYRLIVLSPMTTATRLREWKTTRWLFNKFSTDTEINGFLVACFLALCFLVATVVCCIIKTRKSSD